MSNPAPDYAGADADANAYYTPSSADKNDSNNNDNKDNGSKITDHGRVRGADPAEVEHQFVRAGVAVDGKSREHATDGEESTDPNEVAFGTTDLSIDSQASESDADSAIGNTSEFSSTQSVRSSIYNYVEENGRTYHRFREGKYYLPNDEIEQDRLDLQHHLFLLTLNGELHTAPIESIPGGIHNVLDFATGTGIWAIEFANKYPSARVVGTDLSPVQPSHVPSNCHFEVDDAEDEWNFSYQFEYIHGRALLTCFKSHLGVFQSAFDALRPGGYLELQDVINDFRCVDDSIKGTHLETWTGLIGQATATLGKDWTKAAQYKNYLEEIGFEDVVEKRYDWPVGTWVRGKRMKLLGLWCREDLLSALEGISLAILTRGLGMSKEAVDVLLVGVRNDIKSNRIHAYLPIRVVYGRKPQHFLP